MTPAASLHPLGAAELLEALDGSESAPVARALALLARATGLSEAELGRWPVGRRDAHLLRLRAQLLGPVLQALAACPACGESVELAFPVEEVLTGPEAPAAPAPLPRGDALLQWRLPTSEDQLALAAFGDPGAAERELWRRCTAGTAVLDGPLREAVAQALAEADPDADIQLALQCPACGHGWSQVLDVPAFVLSEAQTLARRLLGEVHLLASAYGWAERDILALSSWRRQAYLALVMP